MARPWALDDTDRRILEVLSTHGRSPLREVAEAIGCNERTVQDRVARLEAHGVLLGFEATVDWALVGLPVLTLVEAYCPPARLAEAATLLKAIPNVVHAFATTGPCNVMVLARTGRVDDLKQLAALLSATPLERIGSKLVIESLVEDRPPGLPMLRSRWPAKPKRAARAMLVLEPATADRLGRLQRAGLAGLDVAPVAPKTE
jgi:DNA-binding Lrp family transcriptional regulator